MPNDMRDRLIELLDKKQYQGNAIASDVNYIQNTELADYLLENGVILPPCKVGDKVYLNRIHGCKEDNSPIFETETGFVYQIQVDNTKDTIWIGASFGVLHCCRPYTDFYFSKEETENALRGNGNDK